MTACVLGHLVGCSADHKTASLLSPLGPHVDDPVCAFDDFEIMFDDNECISAVAQPQQHFQQFLNICKMKPRGRFVEQVECATGGFLGEFTGQL